MGLWSAYKTIIEAVKENDKGFLELNANSVHWAVINAIRELGEKQRMYKISLNDKDSRAQTLENKVAVPEESNVELKMQYSKINKEISSIASNGSRDS